MFESSKVDPLDPTSDAAPLVESLAAPENAAPASDGKWHVGTLTYTFAGLVILFCWLLWGDFAWSMKERSVQPVIQLLIRKFGGSDTFYSILTVSLPPAITLLIGPVISYRSDRHRGRWGRRIPYLLAPTPLALLAMIGLAFSPVIGRHLHIGRDENQSILLSFAFFWILFEVASITVYSVFNAFVNDVVPRQVLGRFYALFRALSLIAGIIFTRWILKRAEYHSVAIFLSTGLLYFFGFSLMCFKVKEGKYPLPVTDVAEKAGSFRRAVLGYCRDCFTKPYYLLVFATIVVPALAFTPINFFNLYYAQSVGMSIGRFGEIQSDYFMLSLVQAIPLGWLIDRYNPMRVAMVALILHGSASLWGAFCIHDAHTFGIAYFLTGTLSGTWFTATAALQMILFPKLKFAQYASASSVISALVTMLCGVILGPFLDYMHHQYSYTYLIGGILDIIGLIATMTVFRLYLKYGGATNYIAP